jgi:DNA primase
MSDELTIEAVLLHYNAASVPQGVGWRPMICPFHKDHVKSGSVNHDQNKFRCHTCGVAGHPLDLIEKQENLKEAEAVEWARQIFGASVTHIPRTANRSKKRRPLGRNRWAKVFE